MFGDVYHNETLMFLQRLWVPMHLLHKVVVAIQKPYLFSLKENQVKNNRVFKSIDFKRGTPPKQA
jgi:hypothetical protein